MNRPAAARVFRQLHDSGLLILPNAWDAGSARIIEYAGAEAIATSSAAVAWAHGYPDGEVVPHDVMLATVAEVVRAVSVPVSVDIEAGFGSDADAAAAFALRVVEAGAVGVNVEDGAGTADQLVAKIERIKARVAASGTDLWLNARTDVYLRGLGDGEAAYAETIARAHRYRDAGADSIFVPAAAGRQLIARLVRDIPLPLNVLAWPNVPPAHELRELGVRRLSAGSGIAKVALNDVHAMVRAFLRDGRSDRFDAAGINNPQLNELMRSR